MLKSILFILSFTLLSNNSFDDKINEYLKNSISSGIEYEYSIISKPEKDAKIEIDSSRRLSINGSIAYVPVQVSSKRKGEYKSFVTLKMKFFAEVFVASQSIERDSELNMNDFTKQHLEISNVRGTPVLDLAAISNYINNMNINEGDILVEEMISLKPDVRSGDRITIISEFGTVKISTPGFARQNGKIGEIITVRTLDNTILRIKLLDNKSGLIYE